MALPIAERLSQLWRRSRRLRSLPLGYRRNWRCHGLALVPGWMLRRCPAIIRWGGVSCARDGVFLHFSLPCGDTLCLAAPSSYETDIRAFDHLSCDSHPFSIWQEVILLDQYDATRFLSQGGVVIDVGAHIGTFTLLASRLVGQTGSVVAIEPINSESLLRTVQCNDLVNVAIIPAAAGDRLGTARMSTGAPEAAAVHSIVIERGGQYQDVPQRTVDSIVEECGLGTVDLVKIDVEGYESQVLRGMSETIRRFRPVIVAAAYHWPEDPEQLPQLISALASDYHIEVKSVSPGTELECFAVPKEWGSG